MTPPSSRRERNDRHRPTRYALQIRYRRLYDELLEIVVHVDPVRVHSTDASDFAPEAASILARLNEARVADDVEQIVLEELRRWYGRRRLATLDPDRLADTTIAICTVWNRFLTDADP
jgi:hypothetical protein